MLPIYAYLGNTFFFMLMASMQMGWLSDLFEEDDGGEAAFGRGSDLPEDTAPDPLYTSALYDGVTNGTDASDRFIAAESDLEQAYFLGAGDDTLDAGSGAEYAQGGSGDDALHGGAGNDVLWLFGTDRGTGGDGSDMFRLIDANDGETMVTITDFDLAEDQVEVVYSEMPGIPALALSDATIDDTNDASILLDGTPVATVTGGAGLLAEDVVLTIAL